MHTPFGWHAESTYGKLFILYLIAACAFLIFRLYVFVQEFYWTQSKRRRTTPAVPEPSFGPAGPLVMQDATFFRRWARRYAEMRLIKAIAVFTVLLSIVFVAASARPAFENEFNNANIPGWQAIILAGLLQCQRLAAGLCVSALLYGSASVCEALLIRQKADWRYARAITKVDVSDVPE